MKISSIKKTRILMINQFAAGVTDVDSNVDLWDIFAHCRENDVVPNITINGNKMTPEVYDNLVKYCGAVAVSHYNDDTCFNAVHGLTSRGLKRKIVVRKKKKLI
jgi:hypothetical protein